MKHFISTTIHKIIDKLVYPSIRRSIIDWPLDFATELTVMNNVEGDYHEFGVFEGRSMIRVAKRFMKDLPHEKLKNMRFYAYDSFEGLPETSDRYAPSHFYKGSFKAPRPLFEDNFKSAGLPYDQLKIIPGFYDESLTSELAANLFKNRKIAMIYIDCDIYESAIPIFDFITSGLQVGTVLVIDDWVRHHAHPNHGIQRAYNEWLTKNPSIKTTPIALSKRICFVINEI